MAKKANEKPGGEELTPVVYGRDIEEAERFRDLLEDHEIPAVIADEDGDFPRSAAGEVPVLVPAELLEEAGEIIAEREDLDEFEVEDDEFYDEDEDEEDELTELDADVYGAVEEEEEEEEDQEEDQEEEEEDL